jgi:hypothetical protein
MMQKMTFKDNTGRFMTREGFIVSEYYFDSVSDVTELFPDKDAYVVLMHWGIEIKVSADGQGVYKTYRAMTGEFVFRDGDEVVIIPDFSLFEDPSEVIRSMWTGEYSDSRVAGVTSKLRGLYDSPKSTPSVDGGSFWELEKLEFDRRRSQNKINVRGLVNEYFHVADNYGGEMILQEGNTPDVYEIDSEWGDKDVQGLLDWLGSSGGTKPSMQVTYRYSVQTGALESSLHSLYISDYRFDNGSVTLKTNDVIVKYENRFAILHNVKHHNNDVFVD